MNDNTDRLAADLLSLLDRDKMDLNKTAVNPAQVEIKPINDYLAKQKTEREVRAALLNKAFQTIKSEVDKVEHEFTCKIKRSWPFKPKTVLRKASVEKCCGVVVVKFGNDDKKFDSSSTSEAYHAKEVADWINDLAFDMNIQIEIEESGSCSCN